MVVIKVINQNINQMKLKVNKRTLLPTIVLATICLALSCTSDDNESGQQDNLYLEIPDHNFESILIEQGIDSDGVINQKMLKTDAKKVNVLDLSVSNTRNIKDLKGIEGFINLKNLTAAQHEIKEIDLSSNVLLDTLYLIGNNMTTIDISHNTNLVLLDVQANQLTSIIGLSHATHLVDLDLSWNYLEEISIHNESLEVLHLRNNDLKSINLNGAINIKNILLTTNQLTSIDLSTNKALETLLISDNKIESINLDWNSHLTHLYISSNTLTNLDVSQNQTLVDLRADRNPRLTCIKIQNGQIIPHVSESDNQELSSHCN